MNNELNRKYLKTTLINPLRNQSPLLNYNQSSSLSINVSNSKLDNNEDMDDSQKFPIWQLNETVRIFQSNIFSVEYIHWLENCLLP